MFLHSLLYTFVLRFVNAFAEVAPIAFYSAIDLGTCSWHSLRKKVTAGKKKKTASINFCEESLIAIEIRACHSHSTYSPDFVILFFFSGVKYNVPSNYISVEVPRVSFCRRSDVFARIHDPRGIARSNYRAIARYRWNDSCGRALSTHTRIRTCGRASSRRLARRRARYFRTRVFSSASPRWASALTLDRERNGHGRRMKIRSRFAMRSVFSPRALPRFAQSRIRKFEDENIARRSFARGKSSNERASKFFLFRVIFSVLFFQFFQFTQQFKARPIARCG